MSDMGLIAVADQSCNRNSTYS